MVEVLVGRQVDVELLDALKRDVHAPHLLDVEVLSVLSGLTLDGKLRPEAAERARIEHFEFNIERYELAGLADSVWELRHNFTTYDAYYLGLAEVVDAPLYTCDQKLDRGGHNTEVRVFPRSH